MPYKYAIAEHVYEDGIPPQEGTWKRPLRTDLHPVSKEIAETHPDGRYMLVSTHGKEMSDWRSFFNEYRAEDTTKVGAGKPLCDATGNLLAAGDLVMTTQYNKPQLYVMEVVSFTPKKVRVRDVGGWGEGTVKNPDDVVKVDKSHFF
jgi:hypothetical protein